MDLTATYGPARTGLVGTVGYTIYGLAGAIIVARTTSGIYESPAGSGAYHIDGVARTKTMMKVMWDTGGSNPIRAWEDLVLQENNLYLRRRNESNAATAKQTQYNEAGAVYEEADIYSDHTGADVYDGTGGIARRDDYG